MIDLNVFAFHYSFTLNFKLDNIIVDKATDKLRILNSWQSLISFDCNYNTIILIAKKRKNNTIRNLCILLMKLLFSNEVPIYNYQDLSYERAKLYLQGDTGYSKELKSFIERLFKLSTLPEDYTEILLDDWFSK